MLQFNKFIYLVRHTTPKVEKGYAYGQTDLDLVESFEEEAKNIASLLPEGHQDYTCFSSPLKRCRTLASYLKKDQEVLIEPRLIEMNYGDWEMVSWNHINSEDLERWHSNIWSVPIPNGESYQNLSVRAVEFWEELTKMPDDNYLVVSHFGVLHALLAHILKVPPEHIFRIQLDYGALIRVAFAKNFIRVKFLN